MTVSEKGVHLTSQPKNQNTPSESGHFEIDTISYGVQDLVYTRVFAMIVVTDEKSPSLDSRGFQCYGFVCDSRNEARRLTYALAHAFSKFSATKKSDNSGDPPRTRFAIDLRREGGKDEEALLEGKKESDEAFFDSSEA
eukprot:TRINITY_DN15133_c0_g1_i1.p1 TRINITY_DN15133_c0_g1~~TRINITY_DN15133_c0_g1_i1.p1  ORF type:complete len:139 (-),score=34.03 TRINITY_DN15133_c0_g1_i1:22-438(-)